MNEDFSTEQQEYLKGFWAGIEARRGALGGGAAAPDPMDSQRAAQDRVIAAGGRLVAEEEAKRKTPPLDRWDVLVALSAAEKFPKGTDVFLTKYFGLFYVAPAQDSYMCRLRIPGGILAAHQLSGLADLADDCAGGFADITTRANLQLREIPARAAPELLMRLAELGLTSRGSGADNVRNVTGSPTAGIDKQELLDTRPDARRIHHHILNHRDLYGLPRKFNIAFDGGGRVAVLEDTNDIAFTAMRWGDRVVYRLGLGGITGHRDFARPTGVVVPPDDTTPVSDAILKVFIAHGDRTDRKQARLKYLLDRWGFDRFIAEVETVLGRPLDRAPESELVAAAPQDRWAHVGVHVQKQPGLNWIGGLGAVGRLTSAQMRGLAGIATRLGSGTIRLTVWQNFLVSDVPDAALPDAVAAIEALGLATRAAPLRAGLVACTGNAGCKFAASNTKGHAAALADWLEARIAIAMPVNIHLTGCHHSCAQHYIADIGLLGAKVEVGDTEIEGYDLHVGGGAGADAAIGRLIAPKIAFDDLKPMLLALLSNWQRDPAAAKGFQAFCARHDDATLNAMCTAERVDA